MDSKSNEPSKAPKAEQHEERNEMKQGPIEIVYGFDHLLGYFLDARDKHLGFEILAKQEGHGDVSESLNYGWYLYLRISSDGVGSQTNQISKEAMKSLWRVYGVPQEKIALFDRDLKTYSVLSPSL